MHMFTRIENMEKILTEEILMGDVRVLVQFMSTSYKELLKKDIILGTTLPFLPIFCFPSLLCWTVFGVRVTVILIHV